MKLISTILVGVVCLTEIVYGAEYSNPLRSNNGGDPDIRYHDGWYYMVATNYGDLTQRRARTLDGLKTGEERVVHNPVNDPDPNSRCQIWAPEQHFIDGSWYMYYAAGRCENWTVTDQRTYVLKGGQSPWDPFTLIGKVNTPFFAIDSTIVYINGQRYFMYSCFRSDTGNSIASLCISTMSDPLTVGEEHLISSPTAPWECVGHCVDEGPYALYHDDRVFVTFSGGGCWDSRYAIGLLTHTGGDPLDPASWSKSDGPVFKATSTLGSTGHNSFFKSPDGTEDWLVYHSSQNSNGDCGNGRIVNAKKIEFDSNGYPVFGTAPNLGTVLPGPAGEPA